MTLPASRNTTYTAGSQVKSVDLNALQDFVISLYGGQRGDEITPTSISGTVNNYAPTGAATAGVIRQACAAGSPGATITGMALSQFAGRRFTLVNIQIDGDLLIKHENASSTAANRFTLPGGTDLTIPFSGGNKSATFCYDNTSQRWRLEYKNF